LLAPLALLAAAVGLTAQGVSCASSPSPDTLPELNKVAPALPEPEPLVVV
jgi:hypothetical protein